MEAIVIITNQPVLQKFRETLSQTKLRIEYSAGGLNVQHKDGSLLMIEGPASDAYDFYEAENDLDIVLAKIENPIFYYCYYRGIDLLKEVSLLLFDDSEMLIDNDFGLIIPGNKWVEMIKTSPGWDLRNHDRL